MPKRTTTSATQVVLFDLDGTFADTAPDMAAALNRMRHTRGLPALELARLRPFVSRGARGLLGAGLGLKPESAGYAAARAEFLDVYEAQLVVETAPFPGIAELVETLEHRGILWGIVTNKPGYLSMPVMEQLGYVQRAACIVGADAVARAKPYPDPLLHACKLIGHTPERCWYLGDDECDIRAGRAAGMRTLAAGYGYLGDGPPPCDWGADGVIDTPQAALDWIGRADQSSTEPAS